MHDIEEAHHFAGAMHGALQMVLHVREADSISRISLIGSSIRIFLARFQDLAFETLLGSLISDGHRRSKMARAL